MDEKALENLQVEDIFEATHKAKEKTMKMLEDESTSTLKLALALSQFLAKFAEDPDGTLRRLEDADIQSVS
jgi:hypothetical protein